MKKLVSFLIILSIFAISYTNTAMANLMVGEGEMIMEMQQADMAGMSSKCSENQNKCCIYPFNDASSISNTHAVNNETGLKGKIIDYSFLEIFQTELKENCLEKLTSPPYKTERGAEKNTYALLTGIIKNNN
ncbi:hypothetical protein A9Q91_01245 [Candidatus Gracilibacteria bacterium 28_42_T64]|nr:hypothetical protein A9Q91_01245 [Candidatus Gracilibacteria bacterium 28_42_T64]